MTDHSMNTRLLIINADDFGYCPQRNKGILGCIRNEERRQGVTSVSILVNGSAAAELAAQLGYEDETSNASFSTGLHFNVTEGSPISPPDSVSTLLNQNKMFLGKFGFREEIQKGTIKMNEVEEELRAQIKCFLSLFGKLPSHVDGHQHIHVIPGVRDVCIKVMSEFGIHWTRIPDEQTLSLSPWINKLQRAFYEEVVQMAEDSKPAFHNAGIRSADCFVGMSCMGKNMNIERLKLLVTNAFLKAEVSCNRDHPIMCELMVHPGYPANEGEGGCGEGPDDFALSPDREHEMNILCSTEWLDWLQEQKIQLIKYPSA